MSIQKKSFFKVIASTALVGFFASCAEIAPPDGAGDEFSEGSCQEIWGINSKCDEVQKKDDQNQEPESSASKDAEDETSSDSEDDSSDSEGGNSEGGNSEEGGNEDDSGSEEGSSEGEGSSSDSDDAKESSFEDGGASIGTNDMTDVSEEVSKTLDDLKKEIDEGKNPEGFEEVDKNISFDDWDKTGTYYCFTGENEWKMISLENLESNPKASGYPFLWNGHASGLARQFILRFEASCSAVYLQRTTN